MACDMPDEYAIRQNVELGLHKKTHTSQFAELKSQKECLCRSYHILFLHKNLTILGVGIKFFIRLFF